VHFISGRRISPGLATFKPASKGALKQAPRVGAPQPANVVELQAGENANLAVEISEKEVMAASRIVAWLRPLVEARKRGLAKPVQPEVLKAYQQLLERKPAKTGAGLRTSLYRKLLFGPGCVHSR
jgi:hypothetical protein